MKSKKYIGIGILTLFILVMLGNVAIAQATVVSVSPSTQNVAAGETFTLDITIDPSVPIAGVQFDLCFNPSLVNVNSVTEGDLLKQSGTGTYFNQGVINHSAGAITSVYGVPAPKQTVSSQGVFATIQMTAKSIAGTSTLNLLNVIVGDDEGTPLSITVNNGSATVDAPTPTEVKITSYAPETPVYDIEGATRTFNVTVNQTVNVSWQINGTEVQRNESVTEATYTNQSAAEGIWNVSAIVTNTNGTDMQVWVWNVTKVTPEAPEIAAYAPGTPVQDIAGATRTFNVTVNQTVNVSWQINGTEVQLNESVTEATYTNQSAAEGTWNVSVTVTNANGTDMQVWVWNVTKVTPEAPEIAAYAPGTPVQDIAGATRTFNVTVNQQVNVSWQINGTEVQRNETVTEATYTNQSAANGTWTVSAVVSNANGTAVQTWLWHVGKNQPPIASFSYSPGNPVINQTVTLNATDSTDQNGNITNYEWDFDDSGNSTNTTEPITNHTYASAGTFTVTLTVTDDEGATNATSRAITVSGGLMFDTGTGTYPSIAGTHNGTITPNVTIQVSKLYTYPCAGTGGHTEHVIIWNESGVIIAEAEWDGYQVDGHTITFDVPFELVANETYDYTIRTGSYPQIIHADSKAVAGGTITCTSFVDTNGNEYEDWIPAIRFGV